MSKICINSIFKVFWLSFVVSRKWWDLKSDESFFKSYILTVFIDHQFRIIAKDHFWLSNNNKFDYSVDWSPNQLMVNYFSQVF